MLLISNAFSQTKEETIEWLNYKLAEETDAFMGKFQIQVNKHNDWGEIISFSEKNNNPLTNEYYYKNYVVLPKNIKSVITTTEYRTDGGIGIKILTKGNNINVDQKEFINEVQILCKNGPSGNDVVKRIQKGLIHLLNLLGNTTVKLPKELFKG